MFSSVFLLLVFFIDFPDPPGFIDKGMINAFVHYVDTYRYVARVTLQSPSGPWSN